MQTVAGWPTDTTVTDPTAVLTAAGVVREASSVRITRELGWSPAGGGSGITAATGEVSWSPTADVASRSPHPWSPGPWPPKPGEALTVDLGYGEARARQITGVVEDSRGAFSDGSVSSSIVDLIDRLNQPLTFPPTLASEPGNVGQPLRRLGLTGTHLADRVLRACGFYATPPQWSGSVFSAPLMGSATAERGYVDTTGATDPTWGTTPWGQGATALSTLNSPAFSTAYPGTLTAPVQLILMVAPALPTASGSAYVLARWGSAGYVSLTCVVSSGVRTVRARLNDGTTTTDVASLPALDAVTFSVIVTPAGLFTITSDDGRTSTGTATLPAAFAAAPMSRVDVQVTAGSVAIGGAQVAFSSSVVATAWKRTAVLTPPTYPFALAAFPAVLARTGLSLLTEQASAERAAMWIDEHGVFRWLNRDVLVSGEPVATLTSMDNLLDLEWESSISSVRSGVTVKRSVPTVRIAPTRTVTVWSGRGETLASLEVAPEFIGPEADTEWIAVDTGVQNIAAAGGGTALNTGVGSLTGGVLVQDGVDDIPASASHVASTITPLDPRRWLVESVVSALPAGKALTMRVPDTASVSAAQRRSSLPGIRAGGPVVFTASTLTGATAGPAGMPALEHDTGPWIQSTTAVQTLADWLATRATSPAPTIRSLRVVPDMRLQLGDVVLIDDPDRSGMLLRVLVTGITMTTSVDGGRVTVTQTLSVYVLSATVKWPTLDEVDAANTGSTFTAFDAAHAGATLATFDNAPLT